MFGYTTLFFRVKCAEYDFECNLCVCFVHVRPRSFHLYSKTVTFTLPNQKSGVSKVLFIHLFIRFIIIYFL